MGRKSRHYRDESDPLLGIYSQTLAATSSVRSSNPSLYSYNPHQEGNHPTGSKTVPSPSTSVSESNSTSPLKKKGPLNFFSRTSSVDSSTSNGNKYGTEPSSTATATSSDEVIGTDKINVSTRILGGHMMTATNNKSTSNQAGGSSSSSSSKDKYRVHRVSYTAQNHVQVIFRLYGSAFPQVLPFCLLNILWTLVIYFLEQYQIADLTFHSSVGHSFMGLLVSFLIVSRSKISYDRFMDFRRHLATTYKTCRELAQLTTVYSFATQTPAARQWRQDVCFQTIVLLRVTMDALLWSSTERDQWEEEYYAYHPETDSVPIPVNGSTDVENGSIPPAEAVASKIESNSFSRAGPKDTAVSEHFFQFRSLTHGRRSNVDENFRAPIAFSHRLRLTIMEHPGELGYKLEVNEYRDLVLLVGQFMDAFHAFRVLVFTPYPFPLVQMTRAFLFFWVYTLPMVLLKEYRLWSSILIVILVSIGFVGIEYVSMALDDPFGDDTNDVDEHGMALLVYEDIYMALYRTDGYPAAVQLRERVLGRYKRGRGLHCYREDLKGNNFWEPKHLRKRHEEEDKEAMEQDHFEQRHRREPHHEQRRQESVDTTARPPRAGKKVTYAK